MTWPDPNTETRGTNPEGAKMEIGFGAEEGRVCQG
jgi:hypothetical protein